ncbi:DUF1972 domain-containing protein [Amaricoccus solimangrovi]|uniref:Glycosyltransferase family 1 protein n=1 Tax=Amaricoccus solimangrovi TaxID=2589815 RepID=A0A501WFI8_9RHOB|nr:DUF1972 domain-containing protein [Amaricoccus solimangrovi]TPE48178.1 glycosyltransferase family 1 protein [Amaricoccus solimangrovi]
MYRGKTERYLNIIGTRGIPANHGGFETFAERLALHLTEIGWGVTVYCQDSSDPATKVDTWNGVRRVTIHGPNNPLGTITFDVKCVLDCVDRPGIDLVLGYNTAFLAIYQRLKGRYVVINMDGIEWKRSKWSLPAKLWFLMNELIGANVANRVIADHPRIRSHLQGRTRTDPIVIPYGADALRDVPWTPLPGFEIAPDRYFLSVARLEPENSILEIIRGFVQAAPPGFHLVVLGQVDPENAYHRALLAEANDYVHFPGGIYDKPMLGSLRYHARAYVHGHQVGGTNPSLVEALGAGSAVLAHDNRFNRWTTGRRQFYFRSEEDCAEMIARLARDDAAIAEARDAARERFETHFQWGRILRSYEMLLERALVISQEKPAVRFRRRVGRFFVR